MLKHTAEGKSAWRPLLIGLLFWLPLLSGIFSRFIKQSAWFGDYGAVACAAEKSAAGAPMYDMQLACEGMTATVYVYHPWVAQAFAAAFQALGRSGLFAAYIAVFAAAVAFLIWFMVGREPAGPRHRRAWFAAFVTGSAVYWANIGVILHALVASMALTRVPLLLALAIAVSAVVKPTFLTFAAVFLLFPMPAWRRIAYLALTIALGAAPTLLLLQSGSPLATQWWDLVSYFVYVDRPGSAFLGWADAIGAPVSGLPTAIAYLSYCSVLVLATVALAETLELDLNGRVALGLSLGVLLIPRLMSQDFWLLGPGLIWLTAALAERAPSAGRWLGRVLLATCSFVLLGNLADFGDLATPLGTLACALALIGVALWTLTMGGANLSRMWAQILHGARPTQLV